MFVDQNFPEGQSGGELLSRLKASHLMDQRVAFLISSEPTVENMKHAMACGARGVLAKPFDRAELKKQLEVLRSMKGTGTELISVYMPPGYAVHEVANKLREEAGQASNIKSKSTRKNVTDALERILQHLKLYRQAPENGMAIFCGNVSENPARTDIELYTVFPHEKINVQLYRCDSRFFLEPLERLLDVKDSYGLLVMDGREATLAVLRGTNVQIVRKLNSTAHAKIRKGGQCLAPDTMVALSDGRLMPVGSIEAGEWIKGTDLSRFEVGDWVCSDRFETRAKKAYRIVAHAPKMEIVATAWHRFFTVGENGARETYAKDLKIKDTGIIIIPSILNYNEEEAMKLWQ